MKTAIPLLAGLFALAVASSSHAQRIASVDLTKGRGVDTPPPASPTTCGAGVSDGNVISAKGASEIQVEVVRLSNETPSAGEEIQAQVRLQNIGEDPIQIPWSTDPSIKAKGQGPDRLRWEWGIFVASLNGDDLRSLAVPLYGSEFSPGSQLTIRPGEWIEATIKFKLEIVPPTSHVVKAEDAQLSVSWSQAEEVEPIKDCTALHENYDYSYEEVNPPRLIRVTEH